LRITYIFFVNSGILVYLTVYLSEEFSNGCEVNIQLLLKPHVPKITEMLQQCWIMFDTSSKLTSVL